MLIRDFLCVLLVYNGRNNVGLQLEAHICKVSGTGRSNIELVQWGEKRVLKKNPFKVNKKGDKESVRSVNCNIFIHAVELEWQV